MRQVCARTACTWTVRYTEPRDLAPVLRLTESMPAPHWARQGLLRGLQAHDVSSWVAEAGDQVVGFVGCRFVLPRQRVEVPREEAGWGDAPVRPLRLLLLHIAVAPEYRRRGVGKALMARVEGWLRQPEDCVQAPVPESNLATQLFLRSLGYKAVRVLRGYYGAEDAYAMERRPE